MSEQARNLLIYIDLPSDTGADFSFRVSIGEAAVTKQPSVLEEHVYRDTWGKGRPSYLTMMYERLALLHELLSEDGSLLSSLRAQRQPLPEARVR